MKMTKEEWKALSDRYELALRPTQHAVAMKWLRGDDELAAIPNCTLFEGEGTGCKAIGLSSFYPVTCAIEASKFMSSWCAINNGLQAKDEEWRDGVLLSNLPFRWHHRQDEAKKHVAAMDPVIPDEPYKYLACSCLADNDIEEPDVISLQLGSEAAFHLLAGLIEDDYRKIPFNFGGESTCADTWMYTLATGKPGLSLGCRGDRATGGLQFGEVRLTMTTEDLVRALDGVETLAEGGIDYPYYPCNMLKDQF